MIKAARELFCIQVMVFSPAFNMVSMFLESLWGELLQLVQ